MVVTVLGCQGAYPGPGQPCSGYLVDVDGYRLVVDLGYGTVQPLLERVAATDVDAVLVTHGHPDHCADLSPLIRARRMADDPPAPLPVYAPAGALDRVLALDDAARTAAAVDVVTVVDGDELQLGPITVVAAELPHHVPNLGYRVTGGGATLAYTGDCGPDPAVVELARDSDLFLVEATHLEPITGEHRGLLTDVESAVAQAGRAGAVTTWLTHRWPGTPPAAVRALAAQLTDRDVQLAEPSATWSVSRADAG